jgi:hypothetical protein
MDDREERIRIKAYEIWERQGRTGDPEDHWYEAEREIASDEGPADGSLDHSEAQEIGSRDARASRGSVAPS